MNIDVTTRTSHFTKRITSQRTTIFLSVLAGVIFAGFSPVYREAIFKSDSFAKFAHSIFMTLWLPLVIVQSSLIPARRIGLHRLLGKLSLFLIVMNSISVLVIVIPGSRAHFGSFSGFTNHVYLPLQLLFAFNLFYGLAMYYRKNRALHRGYIITSTVILIGPGLTRLQLWLFPAWFPLPPLFTGLIVTDLILLGLIAQNPRTTQISRTRIHSPYLVSLITTLALQLPHSPLGNFAYGQLKSWVFKAM